MITYNHEKYISRAIEGIINQKTKFPIQVVIGEDCSTDGTRTILLAYQAKYPNIIRLLLHDKNKGMICNFIDTLHQCDGEYIAICDGDDYWEDPLKLQKQIDFLEANPTASICWTRYSVLLPSGSINLKPEEDIYFKDGTPHEVSLNNLFDPYTTLTLTAVFKRNILLNVNFKYFKDNTLYAIALAKGEGFVLNDFTAVYRLHENGTWSSLSRASRAINDYNNITEIYKTIPEARTRHIKNIIFLYVLDAYDHVYINLSKYGEALFYSMTKKMILHASLKDKVKASKWLIASLLRKAKILK